MKDWQLDAMWENESDRIWEEQNKDVDLTEAITWMGYAYDHACDTGARLAEAAESAKGTVFDDRIMSIFNDLERLQDDINSLQERMKEEQRRSA